MGIAEMVGLALGLGADCLSVCIGMGMSRKGFRTAVLAPVFGVLQGGVFLLGHAVASAIHTLLHFDGLVESILDAWDIDPVRLHDQVHQVLAVGGAAVLCVIGANMIVSGVRCESSVDPRFYRGRVGLVIVAASVNVDAFVTGLGLGMLGSGSAPTTAALLAFTGGALAWMGLSAGRRLGRVAGRFAHPVGGVLLLLIAFKVMVADLG